MKGYTESESKLSVMVNIFFLPFEISFSAWNGNLIYMCVYIYIYVYVCVCV